MDVLSLLKRLETECEELFQSVEEFFSPGFDKYNAYSSFQENFAADVQLESGPDAGLHLPEIEDDLKNPDGGVDEFFRNAEEDEEKRKYIKRYRPLMLPYPGVEIERVPAHVLGYGVLGRCFPYSGLIQIRQDLYGDEFAEVLAHELTHLANPHWSELDVRTATRNKLPFTPRWH